MNPLVRIGYPALSQSPYGGLRLPVHEPHSANMPRPVPIFTMPHLTYHRGDRLPGARRIL